VPEHSHTQRLPGLDVPARAGGELVAAVVLGLADRPGDLVVAVAETSRSRNTARSTGDRLSGRTRNAVDGETAVSACCAASSVESVRSGSGGHVPV
jgi:hypothetical protein